MPYREAPLSLGDSEKSSSSISSASSSREIHNPVAEVQSPDSNLSENGDQIEGVPYEPIIIPQEPSLDELLKQVAGTSQLNNVTEISLRIVSHMISLQRINMFMPNLVKLNLEGSIVTSFRDLGCDVHTIRYLNVSRCGLSSMDGIHGLQTVDELICDYNSIEDVSPCCGLENLRKLSLQHNCIKNIDSLSFLELCPKLKSLNFLGNPVVESVNYRMCVKNFIPHLAELDGVTFFDAHCVADVSSSEYKSSSITSSDSSLSYGQRPQSTNNLNHENMVMEKNERNARPSSAMIRHPNTSSALTSGEPLCGNIVTKIRRRRRHIAWADSQEDASSSSESLSSLSAASKSFPNQLPQQPIELELGVIGNLEENTEVLSSQKLLEMAKKWRVESQKTRERVTYNDNMRILNDYNGKDSD